MFSYVPLGQDNLRKPLRKGKPRAEREEEGLEPERGTPMLINRTPSNSKYNTRTAFIFCRLSFSGCLAFIS